MVDSPIITGEIMRVSPAENEISTEDKSISFDLPETNVPPSKIFIVPSVTIFPFSSSFSLISIPKRGTLPLLTT